MNPTRIAGIDGFRHGWFVILMNPAQGRVIETRHQICGSFKNVLNLTPAEFLERENDLSLDP